MARSILPRRSRFEFAQPAWPSTRVSQTGRSGADQCRAPLAVGKSPPRPKALVPVLADHPGVAGMSINPGFDASSHFFERVDPRGGRVPHAPAPRSQRVGVGIDQTRVANASGRFPELRVWPA